MESVELKRVSKAWAITLLEEIESAATVIGKTNVLAAGLRNFYKSIVGDSVVNEIIEEPTVDEIDEVVEEAISDASGESETTSVSS
jgi:hypothetical protein